MIRLYITYATLHAQRGCDDHSMEHTYEANWDVGDMVKSVERREDKPCDRTGGPSLLRCTFVFSHERRHEARAPAAVPNAARDPALISWISMKYVSKMSAHERGVMAAPAERFRPLSGG